MRLRCTALRTPSDATSIETPRNVSVETKEDPSSTPPVFLTWFSAHSGRPAPPPTFFLSSSDASSSDEGTRFSITTTTLDSVPSRTSS